MKKTSRVLFFLVILLFLASCSKSPKKPETESGTGSENDRIVPGYTDGDPDIIDIFSSFPSVEKNTDLNPLAEDEVNTLGIQRTMKEEDIVFLLGEPEKTEEERDETLGYKVLVYENVRIVFIKTWNGAPYENGEIYCAEFSDPGIDYPRGIRLGDSLYDVLQKFPREYDYRSGHIYGDGNDKNDPRAAVIGYEAGDILTVKVSCGYWPLLRIEFNDDLKVCRIVIVYNPGLD